MAKFPLSLCWLLSALGIRSYKFSLSLSAFSFAADILLEISILPRGPWNGDGQTLESPEQFHSTGCPRRVKPSFCALQLPSLSYRLSPTSPQEFVYKSSTTLGPFDLTWSSLVFRNTGKVQKGLEQLGGSDSG